MLAFRKTEIASDLLGVAMGVPFQALQANGEPCVRIFISIYLLGLLASFLLVAANTTRLKKCDRSA